MGENTKVDNTVVEPENVKAEDNNKDESGVAKIVAEALAKQKEEFEKLLKENTKQTAATEKDKLYSTLEAEKAAVKEMKDKLSKYEEEEQKKNDELEKKKKDEMDIMDRLRAQEEELEIVKKRSIEYMKATEDGFNKELAKRDLQSYRLQKIAKAEGKIIPEMVVGSSVEEIDKAYERSVGRYNSIISTKEEQDKAEKFGKGVVPKPDGVNNIDNSSSFDYESLFGKSAEEFDAIKKNALNKFLK